MCNVCKCIATPTVLCAMCLSTCIATPTAQCAMCMSTYIATPTALCAMCISTVYCNPNCAMCNVCGASKIKLKKVNKKRTVTVRRLIIFLNISRHPLLIFLQCCLHQYKTLKAVDGNNGDSFADPCQEFKEGFFGVSSGLPLV
jgi:hypothetical protein